MEDKNVCPFILGEIAVFESWMRHEKYINTVRQVHIDYWGSNLIPKMSKATLEQKRQWYENGESELVIEQLQNCG